MTILTWSFLYNFIIITVLTLNLNKSKINELKSVKSYNELLINNNNFDYDIIIIYYTKRFCKPCNHFIHELNQLQQAYLNVNNLYFVQIDVIKYNINININNKNLEISNLPSIYLLPSKTNNINNAIIYQYQHNNFNQELRAEYLSNWIQRYSTVNLNKFNIDFKFTPNLHEIIGDKHNDNDQELELIHTKRPKNIKKRNIQIGIVVCCIIILIICFITFSFFCSKPIRVKSE